MFDHEAMRRARMEKGLTIPDLHRRLVRLGVNVSEQAMRNWEAGKVKSPDAESLYRMAKILRVSHESLLCPHVDSLRATVRQGGR